MISFSSTDVLANNIVAALTPSYKHGNIYIVPDEEALAHEDLDQLEIEKEGLSSCEEEIG